MNSLTKKINILKKEFADCLEKKQVYQKIIQLGLKLPPLWDGYKIEENRVYGCQSMVFLLTTYQEGKLYFQATADALISAGLAYLLVSVFSGEAPETIVQEKATYLEELGIYSSLSLNRSHGLSNMLLHMKKKALQKLLTLSQINSSP